MHGMLIETQARVANIVAQADLCLASVRARERLARKVQRQLQARALLA